MSERLYYVQDKRTYVGNCALFWGKNRSGYVCDPAEAHVFTESEIKGESWRETDVPLLKDEVDAACVRHFRVDTSAFKRVREATGAALGPMPCPRCNSVDAGRMSGLCVTCDGLRREEEARDRRGDDPDEVGY